MHLWANCRPLIKPPGCLLKSLLFMKWMAIFMLAACLQSTAAGHAQTISLSENNATLEKVFTEIQKQAGYDFFYESRILKDAKPVDIHVINASIEEVLAVCFRDQALTFTIYEKTIIVKSKLPDLPVFVTSEPARMVLRGRVVDDKSGEPVGDASVMVKGSQTGVNTDRQGEFSMLHNGNESVTLVITHIGYADKEVIADGTSYITVRLLISEESMANVEVSTGMYKRKKESFTGATATFTGTQLRQIGNRNVIQSLKTLDPSFIVVENNQLGSNPNRLPTIELRGKTSITTTTTELNSQFATDPNLPLFVLNGFPTSLQLINNLDMNRVASITILKDAASTAIWGSKAANGVVIIETKRPIAGELRVTYTGDFLVDAPDLSSYNMMDAREKLEFEKLAGLYVADRYYTQYDADLLYNRRLASIERGVNTYWLSEPVRTGFTHGHSLQLTGGNNELLFGAGVSYKDQQGVMKGSDRKIWGANMDLTYRKGKLNISNQLYLSGYKSNESPFGGFSVFAGANPFLLKRNEDGSIPRYSDENLEYTPGVPVPNPLFNASIFSIHRTRNLDITNNLQGVFTISPELWLQGGLQMTSSSASAVVFISPENTMFDGNIPTERGSYTRDEPRLRRLDGNLSLSYARLFNQAHTLNFTLRSDVSQQNTEFNGTKVIGFPVGTNGNPAFAFKYDPYSQPPSSTSVVHAFSTTASLNYAWKMRYVVDLVYTLNGSNAFGSDNKYQPSWSAGFGWNLHKESFFQRYNWLNLLKVRANIGVSGNDQLGTFSSSSVFSAQAVSSIFGQSLVMTGLGNPGLEWQNTRSISTGLELTVLNNRVSAVINYYEKMTDPLIVSAFGVQPSSSGLQFAYPVNVGKMTYTGWELNLRVSPIYRVKERIVWTLGVTGSKMKGKYGDFGSRMDAANKEQLDQNGLIRYTDGYSPDDIWAVRSMGIDPATGREIFLKKDGLNQTFNYDAADIVRVGNLRPDILGVLSSSFTYKGFYLGIGLRYQLAGYMMNTSVYNKVENISFANLRQNQDRRALYDRWKQPGDIAPFKGIGINSYTPISSRFVQKDSQLVGESLSIGWDFLADSWISRLNMQSLRVALYTSDLFRLTSVQIERGLDYPFSRSFSLGITASF